MNTHHDFFLQPKHHFDWIARRWANWAKIGENSPILQTLPNFSKTVWWIFFKFWEMIIWVNTPRRFFRIFDWIIFAQFMGKKWAKLANLRTWAKFSQKLSDKFFFNHTKWRLIMISFCSQNAILIESPEGGQIGQKWAKICQFYKLCLFFQKLFDEFFSHCTKWRVIMTACSSWNTILIE